MSTYEGEHTIFGLLGQANLTQNDVLLKKLDLKQFGIIGLEIYYRLFFPKIATTISPSPVSSCNCTHKR
jgi:hypothetical protein